MTTSQVKRKREDSDNEKEPIKTENDTKPKKGNMENGAAATSQPKSNGVKEKPKLAGSELSNDGAYARLSGKDLKTGANFTAYVSTLPTLLGREHSAQPKDGFISLGKSKQISRIHAEIDYDKTLGCYTIEPKGKNSVVVRKVQYAPRDMKSESKKIRLNSKDPVRIGNIGFYFLRSTFEKPKEAYADLARNIFKDLPEGTTLGTREVCKQIVANHLFFQANHSTPEAFTKLTNSLQQALRRSDYFERCGNKQRAEWKLKKVTESKGDDNGKVDNSDSQDVKQSTEEKKDDDSAK